MRRKYFKRRFKPVKVVFKHIHKGGRTREGTVPLPCPETGGQKWKADGKRQPGNITGTA